MEFKENGIAFRVAAAEQSSESLVAAYQEIMEVAASRGLLLPGAAGAVALEGAQQAAETVDAPTLYTKESIIEQLAPAYGGYTAVITDLNAQIRLSIDTIKVLTSEDLAEEFEAWYTEDKLVAVVAAQEADPTVKFTLVATPNRLVDSIAAEKAAIAFGANQPSPTYVWDALYGRYYHEQLSGTNPNTGKAVQFSLMPSNFTPEMDGTVSQQIAKLAKLQADHPDLKVPSVLEAITYWHTLRAHGEEFADDTTLDRTCIRHFDLPEQRIGSCGRVPRSGVNTGGKPFLSDSPARNDRNARLSVG